MVKSPKTKRSPRTPAKRAARTPKRATPAKELSFYCVKCRVKRIERVTGIVEYKNARSGVVRAAKAKCRCGTSLTRFVPRV